MLLVTTKAVELIRYRLNDSLKYRAHLQKLLLTLGLIVVATFSSTAVYAKSKIIDLKYSVVYNGASVGHINTQIESKGNSYSIYSKTSAEGIASILMGGDLIQKCKFDTLNDAIRPTHFVTEKLGKKSYTNTVTYDWKNRKINFNNGENSSDMPKGYILDNCNFHFATAFGKDKHLKKTSIYVVDGKKNRMRGYQFVSSSKETIDTPMGKFNTTKIVLRRELNENKKLVLWLADDKPFYPIKFMDSRKSSDRTMLLQSVKTS